MHGFLEVDMGDKPALRPKTPIGPALRAIAASILAHARKAREDGAAARSREAKYRAVAMPAAGTAVDHHSGTTEAVPHAGRQAQ